MSYSIGVDDPHLTDYGNAQRLSRGSDGRLLHVKAWGRWYCWDGQRWAEDRTGRVMQHAKATVRMMHLEAIDAADREWANQLTKWAYSSESERRLNAMVSLARTEPNFAETPEALDADPWLFNVKNGTIDLRTGRLQGHRPVDRITRVAGIKFDPEARAPRFEAFLDEIMGGDGELVGFLRRYFGYALIGEVLEHCLVFFYGLGANGKTTLLNVILGLFGEYGQQADPSLLIRTRSDAHPTSQADLKGARLAVLSEIDKGRYLAESLTKTLTGGDQIKARYMKQDFFEFTPSHSLVMAANHKPIVKGMDEGIWRRIHLVPFTVSIPPARRNPNLTAELLAELPGILNWAISGCLEWQRGGLAPPRAVTAATDAYRADMDTLGEFLAMHTTRDPEGEVETRELYSRYKAWADETGIRAASQKDFSTQLVERGLDKGNHPRTRRAVFRGIRVNNGCEGVRRGQDVTPPFAAHVGGNGSTPSHPFAPRSADELFHVAREVSG